MFETIVRQAVTHEGTFGLYQEIKDRAERIYSGSASPVVLTVRTSSPPVECVIEVLVDGNAISDGVIHQQGFESRTFRIGKARTIDLVLRKPGTSGSTGFYTISVLI